MAPWLLALAGTLAAKQQSGNSRQQLAADLMRRNVQRLGGTTDMLDSAAGQNAIDAQEGQAIGGVLTNSLVGRLGAEEDAKQRRLALEARNRPGMAQGLLDPWARR